MTIIIVDYEVGNFKNIQRAFENINTETIISGDPEIISNAPAIVLPGVGAYGAAMAKLTQLGLGELLIGQIEAGKPVLGICLGMQLLAQQSNEGGHIKGLGLLPMTVERLNVSPAGLKLPHIGWNNISAAPTSRLFRNIETPDPDFYFVHSYRVISEHEPIVAATCHYGDEFICAVERDNIFAVQFHPEKSQEYGRLVLQAFVDYSNERKSV